MRNFLARRMSRGPYWLLALTNSIFALLLIWSIGFVLRHLMVNANGRPSSIAGLWLMHPLFLQFLHLPTFFGTIWRLHDTGHRSWPAWLGLSYFWCLLGLGLLLPWIGSALRTTRLSEEQAIMAFYGFYGSQLVLAGIVIRTIYLCCLRGDEGPNRYGPPPGSASDVSLPPASREEAPPQPERPAAVPPKRMISSKPSFGKRGA
ncbi:MAG TPA: DUF805 domain-containing protein [Rhizomicrobium sp.]|nr:DUF805 domain-containing protein [Rhizomicrobium sp.]